MDGHTPGPTMFCAPGEVTGPRGWHSACNGLQGPNENISECPCACHDDPTFYWTKTLKD